MAISVLTGPTQVISETTLDGTETGSFTFGSGSNRFAIAFWQYEQGNGGTVEVTAMSGGGTWTALTEQAAASATVTSEKARAFWIANPTTGIQTIGFTLAGGDNKDGQCAIVELQGDTDALSLDTSGSDALEDPTSGIIDLNITVGTSVAVLYACSEELQSNGPWTQRQSGIELLDPFDTGSGNVGMAGCVGWKNAQTGSITVGAQSADTASPRDHTIYAVSVAEGAAVAAALANQLSVLGVGR